MKGSRYAILKLIESADFLDSINTMIKSTGASLSIYDNWMPIAGARLQRVPKS
jgi:hypothetical protein